MAEENKIQDTGLKQRIWALVEPIDHEDHSSKSFDYFDLFILALILLNALAVILETVGSLKSGYGVYFYWFEVFSVGVFTIEYLARLWACSSQESYSQTFWGRIKFIFSPMALIDLLAILPFYLTFTNLDLRVVRTLRIFRLFRVMKLVRYSSSISLFGRVLKSRKEELVVTASIVFILMILSASFMYFAEHEAQPEAFPDIPSSMWWAIVTLTTVGYGDVFPITIVGKIFAAVIAILGIGMFALPTGILGASFVEEIELKRREDQKSVDKPYCPHCGEKI